MIDSPLTCRNNCRVLEALRTRHAAGDRFKTVTGSLYSYATSVGLSEILGLVSSQREDRRSAGPNANRTPQSLLHRRNAENRC